MEDTVEKMRWQATDMEKIFAKHISVKRLYLEYAKTSYNSLKKEDNTILNMWRDLNRHFIKEERWMANKHMKRFSTSFVTREIKIKP